MNNQTNCFGNFEENMDLSRIFLAIMEKKYYGMYKQFVYKFGLKVWIIICETKMHKNKIATLDMISPHTLS